MGQIKVELVVGPQGHVFAPGELVSGKVIFQIKAMPEKIDSVQVVFRGKTTTRIVRGSGDSRRTYKEDIYLFKESIQLFRGPFTIQPQTMEWPFSVRFPTACQWDRKKHSDHPSFAPPVEIPLPPSFSKFQGSDHATVDYLLKVKVNEGSFTRSQEQIVPLQFSPLSPVPNADPELRLANLGLSHWSSRELRETSHTLKQKMRHVFTSDPSLKTPAIAFKTALGIPSVVCPGQIAPLAVSIQFTHSGNPVDPENPTLVLEQMRIALKYNTLFRAKSTFSDVQEEASGEEASVTYSPHAALPLDGRTIHPVPDFGIESFRQTSLIKPFASDFISWTINHSHYLKAVLWIRHRESNHLFEVKSERLPFAFHPMHASLGGVMEQTRDVERYGDLLPSYAQGEASSSSTAAPPVYEPSAAGNGTVAEKQQPQMDVASNVSQGR
ncbi:hypothetical protein CAC42_2527 [Sphaceloma murrayae]|uniref:Arrestin-like N-terminal domain-containing protein n=1 Tax=Sphaceloma murrayae TaxID=2082308 RepID=A0A2K1QWL2_9PEZI|nr:hypothetical protein CAC42_2527 [Sphaceloma murrayae]